MCQALSIDVMCAQEQPNMKTYKVYVITIMYLQIQSKVRNNEPRHSY